MNISNKPISGFQMINTEIVKEQEISNYLKSNALTFNSICDDSRRVKIGDLYISIPPVSGISPLSYIQEAINRGACIVIVDESLDLSSLVCLQESDILLIAVKNPRLAKALLASAQFPKKPDYLFGVTGTNGKSSVASFVNQLCQSLGYSSAFMGTTGYEGPEEIIQELPNVTLTSVDALVLHKCMNKLKELSVKCLSLEASSHGLDQSRLEGLEFSAAGFTNIEVDHLDYHKTFDHYCAAKQRLFSTVLSPNGVAVINIDVPHANEMIKAAGSRKIMTYGRGEADIQLLSIAYLDDAQELSLKIFGALHTVTLPLIGDFQAMNALCAFGMVYGVFGRLQECLQGLSGLKAVSGRMQKAGQTAAGGLVYVDYAQNSDGMKTALNAIRPYVKNKLTVLFGCGGGRDLSRRQGMGKAAYEGADRVIITDDNPRYESPHEIRKILMDTCPGAIEMANRKEAISFALSTLGKGDVCLIAGKGHERFEQVGDEKTPYNDFEEAQKNIKLLRGVCS